MDWSRRAGKAGAFQHRRSGWSPLPRSCGTGGPLQPKCQKDPTSFHLVAQLSQASFIKHSYQATLKTSAKKSYSNLHLLVVIPHILVLLRRQGRPGRRHQTSWRLALHPSSWETGTSSSRTTLLPLACEGCLPSRTRLRFDLRWSLVGPPRQSSASLLSQPDSVMHPQAMQMKITPSGNWVTCRRWERGFANRAGSSG